VIRQRLTGKLTVGIYPLLLDQTCWFLAVDFDKKSWQLDAAAFLGVCRQMAVPASLERSRSGNGGHVWIFFDRAIPATTARKLGCSILTQTMERRHCGLLKVGCVWQVLLAHFGGLIWPTLGRCGFGEASSPPPPPP